jgi:hypothetical protein
VEPYTQSGQRQLRSLISARIYRGTDRDVVFVDLSWLGSSRGKWVSTCCYFCTARRSVTSMFCCLFYTASLALGGQSRACLSTLCELNKALTYFKDEMEAQGLWDKCDSVRGI